MIYGYIRVSTDKQTVLNQRHEILKFCRAEKIKIDKWVAETTSGAQDYSTRELGDLLLQVKEGDIIICSELSRLGRNLFMIMEILGICMNKKCRVWTVKDNYRLGDDLQSKVLAFAFALSAEIERNLISRRTKEAMERIRSQGVVLGRPKGAKNRKYRLSGQEEHIKKLQLSGISMEKIAEALGVSRSTINRHLKRNSLACSYVEVENCPEKGTLNRDKFL